MDDDLDDYKLDTTWHHDPSHVVHISFERDRRHRGRKVRVENKWYRQRELGVGSCGVVHLETTEDGRERAVKSIRRSLAERLKIDYRRELAAISTFSKAKVDHSFSTCRWLSEIPCSRSLFRLSRAAALSRGHSELYFYDRLDHSS
jgi:hypothetical protein